MSYDDVLELPLKVFTLYNGNINRLRAEEDTRTIRLLAAVNFGDNDNMQSVVSGLQDELGTVIELENVGYVPMEPDALEKLEALNNLR